MVDKQMSPEMVKILKDKKFVLFATNTDTWLTQ